MGNACLPNTQVYQFTRRATLTCYELSISLRCVSGGSKDSITKMWDPIAYALGFLDCKDISARCMLSIFHFFATKTDASVLRMLNGSPRDRLLQPILDYIEARGGKIHMRTGAAMAHCLALFRQPLASNMCLIRIHFHTMRL